MIKISRFRVHLFEEKNAVRCRTADTGVKFVYGYASPRKCLRERNEIIVENSPWQDSILSQTRERCNLQRRPMICIFSYANNTKWNLDPQNKNTDGWRHLGP